MVALEHHHSEPRSFSRVSREGALPAAVAALAQKAAVAVAGLGAGQTTAAQQAPRVLLEASAGTPARVAARPCRLPPLSQRTPGAAYGRSLRQLQQLAMLLAQQVLSERLHSHCQAKRATLTHSALVDLQTKQRLATRARLTGSEAQLLVVPVAAAVLVEVKARSGLAGLSHS